MKSATKSANHSQGFLRAAALDPEGSLAYMLKSAFGVTLPQCMDMCKQMLDKKDIGVILLCLTAGVQIRNNVVYVGPQFGDMRTRYPGLIIEGQRDVKDMFNFGACHICGHILAEISSHEMGKSIIKKSGSCVSGKDLNDTEAGKINAEIHKSFPAEDVAAFKTWDAELSAEHQAVVDGVLESVNAKSASFASKLVAPTV